MLDPFIEDSVRRAQDRHRNALSDAELERLAKAIEAGRPGIVDRTRGRLGDYLIAFGQRLKPPAPVQAPTRVLQEC